MRLNKFMASSGVASRRHCDEIIAAGRVKINARVCKKLGTQVNPDLDIVTVDNRPIRIRGPFVYYMLNKPTGVVTTVMDPEGRETVMDYIPSNTGKRLYPVGRLDYNTSGLLLITNDGDISQKLMHPSFEFGKTYLATIEGKLSDAEMEKLANGVNIGGFVTSPATVKYVGTKGNDSTYSLTIHEGKNRQVRKMFLSVGYKVKELQRVALGKLQLGDLPVGEYRPLTEQELDYLRNL